MVTCRQTSLGRPTDYTLPRVDRSVWPSLMHSSFRELPPPLIVIGMHRSGTSVTAAMLGTLGVYMGTDLGFPGSSLDRADDEGLFRSGYGEASEFYSLNEAVLARAGATWSNVEPLREAAREARFQRGCATLFTSATYRSLQPFRRGVQPDSAWGWKDPRNSLTLRFWLRLFPQARVLHVRRDLEQTSLSVYRRAREWASAPQPQQTVRSRWQRALLDPAAAGRYLSRKLGFLPQRADTPDPCLDWEHCRRLSREYVDSSLEYRVLGPRYLEIWYEDLLSDPRTMASRLAAFAGCAPSPRQLDRAATLVRTERLRHRMRGVCTQG